MEGEKPLAVQSISTINPPFQLLICLQILGFNLENICRGADEDYAIKSIFISGKTNLPHGAFSVAAKMKTCSPVQKS